MWGAIASAGASILGGLFGGSSAKKAAKQAAQAQADAINKQTALYGKIYSESVARATPYSDLGLQGVSALSDPEANFTTSPGYQFRLDQGLAGITNNKAVGGMLNSGATLKGLSDYGQNTASNEYSNWWNQQTGLANIGTNALAGINGAAQNYSNSMGNAYAQQGANQANYYSTLGNINQSTIGTITGAASAGLNALSGTGWGNVGKSTSNPWSTPGIYI